MLCPDLWGPIDSRPKHIGVVANQVSSSWPSIFTKLEQVKHLVAIDKLVHCLGYEIVVSDAEGNVLFRPNL